MPARSLAMLRHRIALEVLGVWLHDDDEWRAQMVQWPALIHTPTTRESNDAL